MSNGLYNFKRFCTFCVRCNGNTSKAHANTHNGLCKHCVTGTDNPSARHKCSQCGEPISAYKARHKYVCDDCTRVNDPAGYYHEVTHGD